MWLMHVCVSVRDPFQAYAILPYNKSVFFTSYQMRVDVMRQLLNSGIQL